MMQRTGRILWPTTSIQQWKFRHVKVFEVLWVAALYIISARVGQLYAIAPGNVTPIWIPSGLMVALSLYIGPRIWPGIFIGAFSGNVWAYFTLESFTTSIAAIGAGVFNGVGDVISTLVMAQLIHHCSQTAYPFRSLKQLSWYVLFAVFLGSAISALFGVSGLALFQFIETKNYIPLFSTWFIGDGVGALIFGPLLLSWIHPLKRQYFQFYPVLLTLTIFSALATAVIFGIVIVSKWLVYLGALMLPVGLTLMINYSQRTVFTIQSTVAAVAIFATSNGAGPFADVSHLGSLIQLQIFIAIFSFIIYVLAVFTSEKQQSEIELADQKSKLERLYRLDALTGLWNRYRIKEFLEHELARFNREERPFGVIMMDIDDFKKINDNFGHTTGDKILVSLSHLIGEHIREVDLFGRWGGEEFLLIVTDTNQESILILAEKLRSLVANKDFKIGQKITICLGVTLVREEDTELKLLDRVDEALYRSKRQSKDQVSYI